MGRRRFPERGGTGGFFVCSVRDPQVQRRVVREGQIGRLKGGDAGFIMSTTQLNCPGCKQPIATLHHSGRITVSPAAQVSISANGVEVICAHCGTMRVIRLPEEKAADRRTA